MFTHPKQIIRFLCLIVVMLAASLAGALTLASWRGVLRNGAGKPMGDATVKLHSKSGNHDYTARTSVTGNFVFAAIAASDYEVSVESAGSHWNAVDNIVIKDGETLASNLQVFLQPAELRLMPESGDAARQASGGEHLSSGEVSSLPLNARDFSKLLLLAAGTMTDANGAANFTQQFAVNGQRGIATV
ncbi:MAG TPA: carboxypeptidase-like regulatory domain-containing protein, partial [Terriglobales bacterium]|nr:carboxypeptidase-like regulatory domain-containing protein [Terriglobales bacterium]